MSHQLLVRAGYVRQLMAGVYSLLPLGNRVVKKITAIVRDEMDKIGGQEFVMPAMHPAEIWKKSGRWETMGLEMFRLQDRRGADVALGMTHEEIFSHVAAELRQRRAVRRRLGELYQPRRQHSAVAGAARADAAVALGVRGLWHVRPQRFQLGAWLAAQDGL